MRKVKIEKISDKKDEQLVLCPLNPGQYCVSDCAWFGTNYLGVVKRATCHGVVIGELLSEQSNNQS